MTCHWRFKIENFKVRQIDSLVFYGTQACARIVNIQEYANIPQNNVFAIKTLKL